MCQCTIREEPFQMSENQFDPPWIVVGIYLPVKKKKLETNFPVEILICDCKNLKDTSAVCSEAYNTTGSVGYLRP